MNSHGTRFFVVSTGRCGSTLLSRILRSSEEVLSLSEVFTVLGGRRVFDVPRLSGAELWTLFSTPEPDLMALLRSGAQIPEFLVDRARWVREGQTPTVPPLLLIPLPHLCDQPERVYAALREEVLTYPIRSVHEQLAHAFEWLLTYFGRRTWAERSGGSTSYLEPLSAGFPEAKFVHLVRDGRECAFSMARHPYFRLRMARYLAKNAALPVEQCLQAEIPVDRFGAFWSGAMIEADRLLSRLDPERVAVFRYEALVADPRRELERLARFMACPSVAGVAGSVLSWLRPSSGTYRELPTAVRARLERACKPGMRVLERQAAG